MMLFRGALAVKTSELAAIVPPTPAEWAKMADAHLRALRLAYVIANDSLFALASGRQSLGLVWRQR
jgi:hypothetical protein